jgi:hypothetical protein
MNYLSQRKISIASERKSSEVYITTANLRDLPQRDRVTPPYRVKRSTDLPPISSHRAQILGRRQRRAGFCRPVLAAQSLPRPVRIKIRNSGNRESRVRLSVLSALWLAIRFHDLIPSFMISLPAPFSPVHGPVPVNIQIPWSLPWVRGVRISRSVDSPSRRCSVCVRRAANWDPAAFAIRGNWALT